MTEERTLYFGYGSNLNEADLLRFMHRYGFVASPLRVVGPAFLPDFEPCFRYRSTIRSGAAIDVRPRFGHTTPGVLFDVSESEARMLDTKEGVDAGIYRRRNVVALTLDGEAHRAYTYEVCEGRRESTPIAPSPIYLSLVIDGLFAQGLPIEAHRAAAEGRDVPALPSALFVYGTLLPGQPEHARIAGHAAGDWEEGRVHGALVHLGEYPGFIPEGRGRVRGMVAELRDPEKALAELDAFEDFHGYDAPESLYRRSVVSVDTSEGERLAWIYVYAGDREGKPRLASGTWPRRAPSSS